MYCNNYNIYSLLFFQILDMNHSLCSTPEVTDYNFHPDVFHIPCETKSKVAAIPGRFNYYYFFNFFLILFI